jgi:zinc transporter, ZIP family
METAAPFAGVAHHPSSSSSANSTTFSSSSHSLWTPVLVSLLSGMGTTVGGLIVFFLNETPGDDAICFTLSFAAGVMSVVSLTDLLGPSLLAGVSSAIVASLCAVVGMAAVHATKYISVPEPEELATSMFFLRAGKGKVDGEASSSSSSSSSGDGVVAVVMGGAGAGERGGAGDGPQLLLTGGGGSGVGSSPASAASATAAKRRSTWRLGILLCAVLSAHNLPEGVAVGVGVEKSAELGGLLAVAVAIHNIAEGFVVAVPLLAATRDRTFAVCMTAASGLTEPLGALLGVLLLRLIWGDSVAQVRGGGGGGGAGGVGSSSTLTSVLDAVLCAVGGVMLQVSASELLPQAVRAAGGRKEPVVAGFVAGGVVIGATTLLLGG